MAKHTYTGNPGYVYPGINDDQPLRPGDAVELSAEQAATVGDDFKPTKTPKTTPAPADTNKEG